MKHSVATKVLIAKAPHKMLVKLTSTCTLKVYEEEKGNQKMFSTLLNGSSLCALLVTTNHSNSFHWLQNDRRDMPIQLCQYMSQSYNITHILTLIID